MTTVGSTAVGRAFVVRQTEDQRPDDGRGGACEDGSPETRIGSPHNVW